MTISLSFRWVRIWFTTSKVSTIQHYMSRQPRMTSATYYDNTKRHGSQNGGIRKMRGLCTTFRYQMGMLGFVKSIFKTSQSLISVLEKTIAFCSAFHSNGDKKVLAYLKIINFLVDKTFLLLKYTKWLFKNPGKAGLWMVHIFISVFCTYSLLDVNVYFLNRLTLETVF